MKITVPKHMSRTETLRYLLGEERAARELRDEIKDWDSQNAKELKNFELYTSAAFHALLKMDKKSEFFKRPITSYIAGNWRAEFLQ